MDMENEGFSYLRPRDPSLGTEHLTFESVKVNLTQTTSQECSAKNQVPGSMQIHLRLKKTKEHSESLYEVNKNIIIVRVPDSELEKKYKFSNIFQENSTQTDLFNAVVKPKLFRFINGKSSSLFAYGASGSGKTFTIMGTTKHPGIIPRTLEYLFRSLPDIPDSVPFKSDAKDNIIFLSPSEQKKEQKIRDYLLRASKLSVDKQHIQTYKAMQQRLSIEPSAIVEDESELFLGVWVSFAEIYNEDVFDLLKPQESKRKPREKLSIKMSGARPYIKNLSTINISNGLEAYQILQYGLHNLKYASTCVNAYSSRSHSIFTITLVQGSVKTKEYVISYFSFCDLAGSERLKRTLNTGERLKESNNINTSLLVLGKCIRSILFSQKSNDNRSIPYRESKLTQLFQRALCGLEDIAMIININPEKKVFEETLQTLNFSAIAKEVKLSNAAKIVRQVEDDSLQQDAEIVELEEKLLKLTEELEMQETEFQYRMMQMRSQMIGDYNKTVAHITKKFDEEAKRIEKYYNDLFEEELELWKRSYDGGASSDNENEVIIIDSSEDEEGESAVKSKSNIETFNNSVSELVCKLNTKLEAKESSQLEDGASENNVEIVILDSSEDEERESVDKSESTTESFNNTETKPIAELSDEANQIKSSQLEEGTPNENELCDSVLGNSENIERESGFKSASITKSFNSTTSKSIVELNQEAEVKESSWLEERASENEVDNIFNSSENEERESSDKSASITKSFINTTYESTAKLNQEAEIKESSRLEDGASENEVIDDIFSSSEDERESVDKSASITKSFINTTYKSTATLNRETEIKESSRLEDGASENEVDNIFNSSEDEERESSDKSASITKSFINTPYKSTATLNREAEIKESSRLEEGASENEVIDDIFSSSEDEERESESASITKSFNSTIYKSSAKLNQEAEIKESSRLEDGASENNVEVVVLDSSEDEEGESADKSASITKSFNNITYKSTAELNQQVEVKESLQLEEGASQNEIDNVILNSSEDEEGESADKSASITKTFNNTTYKSTGKLNQEAEVKESSRLEVQECSEVIRYETPIRLELHDSNSDLKEFSEDDHKNIIKAIFT